MPINRSAYYTELREAAEKRRFIRQSRIAAFFVFLSLALIFVIAR